jgi:hypothetical protein
MSVKSRYFEYLHNFLFVHNPETLKLNSKSFTCIAISNNKSPQCLFKKALSGGCTLYSQFKKPSRPNSSGLEYVQQDRAMLPVGRNFSCLKGRSVKMEFKYFDKKWTVLGLNKNLYWFMNFLDAPLMSCFIPIFPGYPE